GRRAYQSPECAALRAIFLPICSGPDGVLGCGPSFARGGESSDDRGLGRGGACPQRPRRGLAPLALDPVRSGPGARRSGLGAALAGRPGRAPTGPRAAGRRAGGTPPALPHERARFSALDGRRERAGRAAPPAAVVDVATAAPERALIARRDVETALRVLAGC